jgi:hypothetical protein
MILGERASISTGNMGDEIVFGLTKPDTEER